MQGVCPSPLVVQLDGPLDAWALPLVAITAVDGRRTARGYRAAMLDPRTVTTTGIDIELRRAPADGAAGVPAALHADPTIVIGIAGTEVSVDDEKAHPTVTVMVPWEREDTVLAWSARALPDASVIADLTDTDVRVAGTTDDPRLAYLVRVGLLRSSQLGAKPSEATAHLASLVRGEVRADERWQLLDDAGWSPYPHAVVATPATIAGRDACLRALVPLLQHAVVRELREPARLAANLASIAATMGEAADAETVTSRLTAAAEAGIVGNGPSDVVGDPEPARVQQYLVARAAAAGQRTPDPSPLATHAASLVGRAYFDPTVRIPDPTDPTG